MSYQQYGIPRELVEHVKMKMKDKSVNERIKKLIEGVTRADLQNRVKVKKLISQGSKVVAIPLTAQQTENIADFIIAQRIDPNNTFHLIKLWGMFR